jgi:chromosome segregation ATPase
MNIASDSKTRIFEAADRLYEAAGRESFPTVDSVRREAKVDMNSASSAMKEWRKLQTATPAVVAVAVPEAIGKTAGELVASVWTQAMALANESLHTAEAAWNTERDEAEALRNELSEAHNAQTLEIDGLTQRLSAADITATQTAEQHAEQVLGLTEQLRASDQQVHEGREALAETNGLLKGVSAQLLTVETALTKAETALKTSEQHSTSLEQQLQALRDKNAELLAQLEQATHRATLAEAQIEAQRQALAKAEEGTKAAQVKADQAIAEAKEIDGKLRVLEVSEGTLKGANATLEKQLEALHKTLEKQTKAEPKPKA